MRTPIVFKTTIDRKTLTISLLALGSMVFLLGLVALTMKEAGAGSWFLIAMVAVLPVYLICQGFLPRRIVIKPNEVVIDRAFGNVSILRDTIRSVRRMTREDTRNLLRIAGGAGVFGYFGRFRSSAHPRLSVYARRAERDWILIRTPKRSYVVAPLEGERFIGILNSRGADSK